MATVIKRKSSNKGLVLACTVAGALGMVIGYGMLQVSNLPPSTTAVEVKQATVRFWHDPQRHVGCWITSGDGGMSCLPDDHYTSVSTNASDVPVLKTKPKKE